MVGSALVWRRLGRHRAGPAKLTGEQVEEGEHQLTISSPWCSGGDSTGCCVSR